MLEIMVANNLIVIKVKVLINYFMLGFKPH